VRVKDLKRLEQIREVIGKQGYVSVETLSEEFEISLPTVRRDLKQLDCEGSICRTHGGAYAKTTPLLGYATRHTINHAEKLAISECAVGLVQPGETIYLDPGTTIEQLALRIGERFTKQPLTVVTPSVLAFKHLAECPSVQLILLGGQYNPQMQSFGGPIPQRAMAELIIDRYFLATIGVDPKYGLTDSSQSDCEVKKTALERARTVILLADSSKFHTYGRFPTVALSRVQTVISDGSLGSSERNWIRKAGIELILAEGTLEAKWRSAMEGDGE